jgi:multicomponent Na+:H+ antiporter subunit D
MSDNFIIDVLPLIILLTPLITAVIVPFLTFKDNLYSKMATGIALSIALIASVTAMIYVYYNGPFSYYFGGWRPPYGIEFKVDYLSTFMSTIVLAMTLIVGIFSFEDLSHHVNASSISRYYALYLLLTFSMLGITFSHDIFSLFIFIDITTVAASAIITVKSKAQSVEAGLKYLFLSVLGSGCILLAIALIYMVTGNLNMDYIHREILHAWMIYPRNIQAAAGLMIVGFGVKSALFPLHVWLPDAHSSAPTPSSAVLSGVVVKVYAIAIIRILFTVLDYRILNELPIANLFLILASVSIIFGSVFAIAQGDIKRMLAYSSVAQIGYVYLGIDLATKSGIEGALFHILNHAVMKVGLFLVAGIIIYKTGKRRIIDLRGLGYKMPITMICFSIFALSMIGIPPLNGFFSKFYLAIGALDAGKPIYVVVILLSSLLNAMYYLPIIISSFFYRSKDYPSGGFKLDQVSRSMLYPVVILAASCILLGFFAEYPLKIIEKAVVYLIGK